jgi:hypothetical protein
MVSLVVFSRDPGATERLIAVIERLEGLAYPGERAGLTSMRNDLGPLLSDLQIFSRPPGDGLWSAAGRSPRRWGERSQRETVNFIRCSNAAAVLTGVSDIHESTDRILWRAARAAGIPSHAVMDQRVNLRTRFIDANGSVVYPDWIYVSDDAFAEALVELEVPRQRVRLIGSVHLDRARRIFAAMTAAQIAEIRQAWNVGAERRLVLFISECGKEMAAAGRPAIYDELEELRKFIAAIETHAASAGSALPANQTTIVIRPHPRDRMGKYEEFVGSRPSGLVVACSSLADSERAIAAADLVVGMNSSLLHRASLLGCRTCSLTDHPLGDAVGAQH